MYFRGNLEVGGSDDRPVAETHRGPTRNPGGDEGFQSALQEERRRRVIKEGMDIEALVVAD